VATQLRGHTYRVVHFGSSFGWDGVALSSTDFHGPILFFEQCESCGTMRVTSDENAVRFVTRGVLSEAEPHCLFHG
jgi:hypothetical protein